MQKTFGNIIATLEPLPDGREGVDCFLQQGRYSNSLAVIEDFGEFDDGGAKVSDATINAIRAWAEAHGY